MAAEARVVAEAEFKRKQESAHGEWLEERKKLREETAPQHGICMVLEYMHGICMVQAWCRRGVGVV